jgi:hypothetical protein
LLAVRLPKGGEWALVALGIGMGAIAVVLLWVELVAPFLDRVGY